MNDVALTPVAFGPRPDGTRQDRIAASANFEGRRAVNPPTGHQRQASAMAAAMWRFFTQRGQRVPRVAIPVDRPEPDALRPDGRRLRLTRFGHSSVLLEVDGHLLLTDPMFARRASPLRWAGPRRFHLPPLTVAEVPLPDVVLLSHDHHDHLDPRSVRALAERGARFLAPLGVGGHLERWGVAAEQVTELDWWERVALGELQLVCTPSHHFSGRGLSDRDRTLWCSWAIIGPRHRVWYSGDTGPSDVFDRIGERFGPFDLTMIEIGAWDAAWGDIHLGPDGAVRVHEQVRGAVLLPIHWGTFNLALHAWFQPLARLHELALEGDLPLLVPRFGQVVRADLPAIDDFWRQVIGAAPRRGQAP